MCRIVQGLHEDTLLLQEVKTLDQLTDAGVELQLLIAVS